MSVCLVWLISLLIIPKASSFSQAQRHAHTITAILSLSKIMPSLYSRYAKVGLVCIVMASPLF